MLVLSRKAGESLRIGDGVRLTIVSLSNQSVKIAVDAPSEIAIHREEIYEKIATANQEAARDAGSFERVGDER